MERLTDSRVCLCVPPGMGKEPFTRILGMPTSLLPWYAHLTRSLALLWVAGGWTERVAKSLFGVSVSAVLLICDIHVQHYTKLHVLRAGGWSSFM